MAITESITLQWTRGSESLTKTVSLSNEAAFDVDATVGIGVNDKEVAIAFDKDSLSLIYITTDQALTMETNDGSSADDTFTLAADKPFVWFNGCGIPLPFTADVEALFFSNASGVSATVKIRVLVDGTP